VAEKVDRKNANEIKKKKRSGGGRKEGWKGERKEEAIYLSP
jgi:hypothetical protein